MPRYIIKLEDRFYEWSTVVDAPTTYGMTRYEFIEWYTSLYGRNAEIELEARLERCDKKGVSAFAYKNVDELIAVNRAGPNETCLSKDEIIKAYVNDKPGTI